MISYYFPYFLVVVVVLSGVISIIDLLFFAKKRNKNKSEMFWLVDYARSFFPVLLIVLLIRSFLVTPMVVPSGSLEPTILTGEYLVVNMYKYGLRLPITNTKIFAIDEPKLGDIVVFKYPLNPKVNYVKRVIGVPGDHVVYKDKILSINGTKMPRVLVKNTIDAGENNIPVEIWNEDLNGIKHQIYLHQNDVGNDSNYDIVVPKNMYFMMGDNRDGSADSRVWGFVPEENLIGKAVLIWMSWDSEKHNVRWSRLGTSLLPSVRNP